LYYYKTVVTSVKPEIHRFFEE